MIIWRRYWSRCKSTMIFVQLNSCGVETFLNWTSIDIHYIPNEWITAPIALWSFTLACKHRRLMLRFKSVKKHYFVHLPLRHLKMLLCIQNSDLSHSLKRSHYLQTEFQPYNSVPMSWNLETCGFVHFWALEKARGKLPRQVCKHLPCLVKKQQRQSYHSNVTICVWNNRYEISSHTSRLFKAR